MAQPQSEPVSEDQLTELAQATMRRAKFPMLATVRDGQPCVRPVSPVKVDGFVVYVANLRSYGKTREIELNDRVELCYLDEAHDQVRITAQAEVVSDRAALDAIWQSNPLLRAYLKTPDNPELIIYRMKPVRVRFMREWALSYHEVPFN